MYISWSAKITVSLRPTTRYAWLISLEIAFFFIGWLTTSNDSPDGTTWNSSARPTVVSTMRVFLVMTPLSRSFTTSLMRTLTLACRDTSPARNTRSTSCRSANTRPSPLALIASRVM
ncbi:hypothetical protein D3C86_1767220 [compost metagenome]